MGTFSDLGSSRNSPSAPSNEPHTSPVPGYEAVEATGVASVGAIEPASSSQLSDGGGHQTRKGEGKTGDGSDTSSECPHWVAPAELPDK